MELIISFVFFNILLFILSFPLADEVFILLIMLIIPFAEMTIGDMGSGMAISVLQATLGLRSIVKTAQKALFKLSAASTSLKGSSLGPDMAIGVVLLGFIVFQNFLGLFLSMRRSVVEKVSFSTLNRNRKAFNGFRVRLPKRWLVFCFCGFKQALFPVY